MSVFSNQLIKWYSLNFRQLPWRTTRDPYKIWVSEVILQQTRVAQGLPYYQRFIRNFPTVKKLADSKIEDVLKLWQGLGYYSRARNMHFTAQEVVRLYKGKFPSRYDELIQLKGIGEYTASAISSFVCNEAKPVVDGNVYRVLSRYFGISTPIDSTEGKKIFKARAEEVLDVKNAGQHNQAIMEFGAVICLPKKAMCGDCFFAKNCSAFQTGKVYDLPVKAKKNTSRKRYLNYLVIHDQKNVLMKKRQDKDIWHSLYDFPGEETGADSSRKFDLNQHVFAKKNNLKGKPKKVVEVVHKLSHQDLHIRFMEFEVNSVRKTKGLECIPLSKKTFPGVPQVILRFLEGEKLLKK